MRFNRPNIQPNSAVSFDTLLAFARGTLSEGETNQVKTHLAHSPEDQEVLAGIRLFIEQEEDADLGLELFLDEMEHDYEAILSTYEAEKAANIDDITASSADDYIYNQAVETTDSAQDVDNIYPFGFTGVAFAFPMDTEKGVKAVVLHKNAAAFIHTREENPVGVFKHPIPFVRGQISQDATRILTQSKDHTLRLWQPNGEEVSGFVHEGSIVDKHFSSDGEWLLTASKDGKARLWDIDGFELQTYPHHAPLSFAKFVSNDTRILSGDIKGNLSLWDLPGIEYKRFEHQAGLKSGAVSPSGRQILGITNRYTASLWDLNGNELWRLPQVKQGNFLRQNAQLLFAMADDTAKMWDLFGNELCYYPHKDEVNTALASPDGKMVLTSSVDGTSRIWDINGKQLLCLKHPEPVQWALWTQNAKSVITLCNDQSIRLWRKDGQLMECYQVQDWPNELK